MIELTEQQRQELCNPEPIAIDPQTKKEYVLVGREVYQRLRNLLEDDDGLDMRQVAILIEEAMREEDEGDPLLESYQNYSREQ